MQKLPNKLSRVLSSVRLSNPDINDHARVREYCNEGVYTKQVNLSPDEIKVDTSSHLSAPSYRAISLPGLGSIFVLNDSF